MGTICFTGPRPKKLYGYNHDAYLPLYSVIKENIKNILIPMGYTTYISGGAQGFDQLAFWAVNAIKNEGYDIKNIVYKPFTAQEGNWAKKGLFSQEEYGLMLSLADEVKNTQTIITDSKAAINWLLIHRNHEMVNDSDAVFGLYVNYTWRNPATTGGTAECLRYAAEKEKPIYQLSNVTLNAQWI